MYNGNLLLHMPLGWCRWVNPHYPEDKNHNDDNNNYKVGLLHLNEEYTWLRPTILTLQNWKSVWPRGAGTTITPLPMAGGILEKPLAGKRTWKNFWYLVVTDGHPTYTPSFLKKNLSACFLETVNGSHKQCAPRKGKQLQLSHTRPLLSRLWRRDSCWYDLANNARSHCSPWINNWMWKSRSKKIKSKIFTVL